MMLGHLAQGGQPRRKQIIGQRKNGDPIYLVAGGAPDELEQLEARQRELIDLMEAANKDSADESRSVEQRKDDGATFDQYETEFKENEAKIASIRSVITEREKR